MTVSSELNRKQYAGNGVTTSFATSPVVFFDTSDLVVYVVTTATGAATQLTETTDYTVSGGDGSTGTVSLAGLYGAPSALQTLVIVRSVPLTQATDLVQNDASDAEVMEDALDKLTMADQQLSARLTRSFTLADSDVSGASLTVPTPEANSLVGWNSAGTALENKTAADIDLATVTAFIETLLDDADAATARTTLDVSQAINSLTAETAPATGDKVPLRDVSEGADNSMTLENLHSLYQRSTPGGRITLATGDAVPASDQTGKTTVYYTPYAHNTIEVYDGAKWVPKTFVELSQATSDTTKSPAAVANDSNYDIFVWNDSGTLRASRGPAWSSDTARGTGAGTTELELLEGRYVNKVAITNGPAAQRGVYVGTIRSDGSAQINDSKAKRHVWNNFNRRDRSLLGYFTADRGTNSSSYTELNSEIRVNFLIGLNDEPVKLAMTGSVRGDNTGGAYTHVNVAIDNTTPLEGEGGFSSTPTAGYYVPCAVTPVPTFAGIGSHYATVIMFVAGAGATVTMPGSGSTGQRTALVGIVGG